MKFIPVGKDNSDVLEDMFIKNNNSQIYLSAAASRHLGTPDEVIFLVSQDGTHISISAPDKVKGANSKTHGVRVTRRDDSEACRLAGVPRAVMVMLNGRMDAVSMGDRSLTFEVKDKAYG